MPNSSGLTPILTPFHFRETRLIEELRRHFPFAQPARSGREQVPVFRLPEDALVTGRARSGNDGVGVP